MSDADRLAWALRFAQTDLATWRDGDWLNAGEDASRALDPTRTGEPRSPGTDLSGVLLATGRRGPDPAEIRARLIPLQKELRDLLGRLLKERRAARTMGPVAPEEDAPGERFMMPVEIPFTGRAVLLAEPPFNRLQMFYQPKHASHQQNYVTGTVLRVAELLTRISLDRLKVCPECKRLFVAVRRQRFDTAQCGLRDRVRRFRSKRAKRQRRRVAAHVQRTRRAR